MITLRYYTCSGIYKGWNEYTNKNIPEANEWIKSGNYIKLLDTVIIKSI